METFLEKVNSFIWGNWLIALLITSGLIYTIKLKFIQINLLSKFRIQSAKKHSNTTDSSQFKTICLSLGAAMGTGNILGVSSAIYIGGAGAIFWMWIASFLGMSLVYAENQLSSYYSDNDISGSFAYIEKGIGCKKLSFFFAVMCIGASLGMGGMIQVNSAAKYIHTSFNINYNIIALFSLILILLITTGGAKRICTAAQLLLPLATILYTIVCIIIIFRFRYNLQNAINLIFTTAFSFKSACGGCCGYAVSVGIRRGIFSNEAGLGSSPILHSAATPDSLSIQSYNAMLEVLIDTICCTITALTLLTSSPDLSISGALYHIFANRADLFLAFELSVFAFCTLIGWYYCGNRAYLYITNKKHSNLFPVFFSLVCSLGAVFSVDIVWILSDIFNGLMAVPNILALILLMNKVKRE